MHAIMHMPNLRWLDLSGCRKLDQQFVRQACTLRPPSGKGEGEILLQVPRE